jgi:2-(1,2-epoxy-1,2-dihydrophenyl)acetyl-CoA isomerase
VTDTVPEAEADITAAVSDSVLVLTLNRPSKANALRGEDCANLLDGIKSADGGGDIRAVLIRAAGKNFCAGADLVTANAPGERPRIGHMTRDLEAGPHGLISAIWNCKVPTISAVQGKAMGLGLHLAVACDFTIASTEAVFVEPFCKRGFSVDSAGSFLLPRLVGLRNARRMLLRGITVDAVTAADWGLVDDVVEADVLHAAGMRLAAELASGPTYSLTHTKKLLNDPSDNLDEALAREALSVEATLRSADFKEGLRAFMERRDPNFTGG